MSKSEKEKETEIRHLWLQRPPGQRTENDAIEFVEMIESLRQDLMLSQTLGTNYQRIINIIRSAIKADCE